MSTHSHLSNSIRKPPNVRTKTTKVSRANPIPTNPTPHTTHISDSYQCHPPHLVSYRTLKTRSRFLQTFLKSFPTVPDYKYLPPPTQVFPLSPFIQIQPPSPQPFTSSVAAAMDIESAECECCGLREDCTQDYISAVKADFDGKWLCGLCAEAVRDEANRGRRKGYEVVEAVKAHMSFCSKFRTNPAVRVADGMRQMLRRRSGEMSTPRAAESSKKFGRVTSTPQA